MSSIKNEKLGVWADYFNTRALACTEPWEYQSLKLHASFVTNNFMRGVDDGNFSFDRTSQASDKDLQANRALTATDWALCQELMDELLRLIEVANIYALPAHDLHQAKLDAIEALRFAAMEKPEEAHALFPLAAIAHDIGRFLEGALHDPKRPHGHWIPHAQLSFLLLDKLMAQPKYKELPSIIKGQLLYAVLGHSGDNTQTYIGRATQVVDRWSGLLGANAMHRAISFQSVLGGQIGFPLRAMHEDATLPPYNNLRSAIECLKFFGLFKRPDIGATHQTHRDKVEIDNMAILLKWTENQEGARHALFAPERDTIDGRITHCFNTEVLRKGSELAQSYPSFLEPISAIELTYMLFRDLDRPEGVAHFTDGMKDALFKSVTCMSAAERMAFGSTLNMARDMLRKSASVDKDVVAESLTSDNPLCRQLAKWVQSPVSP